MIISTRDLHWKNAFIPIFASPTPSVTLVTCEHRPKATSSMSLTEWGITISRGTTDGCQPPLPSPSLQSSSSSKPLSIARPTTRSHFPPLAVGIVPGAPEDHRAAKRRRHCPASAAIGIHSAAIEVVVAHAPDRQDESTDHPPLVVVVVVVIPSSSLPNEPSSLGRRRGRQCRRSCLSSRRREGDLFDRESRPTPLPPLLYASPACGRAQRRLV